MIKLLILCVFFTIGCSENERLLHIDSDTVDNCSKQCAKYDQEYKDLMYRFNKDTLTCQCKLKIQE